MDIVVIIIIAATCIFSYMGFNNTALFEKYKFNVGAIANRKEYVRLISSAFLHADFMHLFFNMLSLYFFQGVVISFFGEIGFLILYFGSMILGNLFSLQIYKKQPWYSAIGASGAVSGIIFASIAMAPNEISVNFLPGWLFGTLYFGYSVYMMLNPKQWDNLGHAAHLGGAFFGLVYST
ncbi:rhomboid family intramembrane serine protease [Chryseobacterium indologenes]|uniref:Rhomboid family intramembrane serine protease n=1 Tax=Chryseobacterium indologenes TaxID=253 RepID=A0A411DMI0_CHRID|nr:rhomboid family intramembrane serine protease [Chryseobacterium indologenes]